MKILKLTITIIGILLFLCAVLPHIIFSLYKGINKWDLSKAKIVPIESAIDTYYINTGRYPKTLEDLLVCPPELEDVWKGPYLKKRSQMFDPWGNIYKFEYGYRLQSFGADGIKGGKGENADKEKFIGLN